MCVLTLHAGFVSRVVAVEEKKDFPSHTTYTNAKNVRKRTRLGHVSREPLTYHHLPLCGLLQPIFGLLKPLCGLLQAMCGLLQSLCVPYNGDKDKDGEK